MPDIALNGRPYTRSWLFDGTTSYGTNAAIDYSTRSRLVLDLWFFVVTAPVNGFLCELSVNGGITNDCFYMYSNARTLIAGFKDVGGISAWQSARFPLNRWIHVSHCLDTNLASAGLRSQININGVVSGAAITTTSTGGGTFSNQPFFVGARGGTSLRLPAGTCIKDLRVSGPAQAITPDDVRGLYLDNALPSGFTLLNKWKGEDDGSTPGTAVDSAGGKNLTFTATTYSPAVPVRR